jgi:hypothetical protein
LAVEVDNDLAAGEGNKSQSDTRRLNARPVRIGRHSATSGRWLAWMGCGNAPLVGFEKQPLKSAAGALRKVRPITRAGLGERHWV